MQQQIRFHQIAFQGGPLNGQTLGLLISPQASTVSVHVILEFGHEKSIQEEITYNLFPSSSRAVWPIDASEIVRDEEGRELTGVKVA